VRHEVRRFAREQIAPLAEQIDRSNEFPRALWPKLGAQGLLGITVPERWGGANLGYLAHIIVMEEISRASGAVGLSYGAHSNLCVNQLYVERHRCAAQPHYLPRLLSGEHVGALAMSEPGAGSDVTAMQLRANADGDRYLPHRPQDVDHQRPDADVLVVYAKTEPCREARGITAFIVEANLPGFSHRAEARQARHARLEHLRAGVRGLRGAGRQRARRPQPGRARAHERARL
jgi:isovaleryl-CoA dehydrogenase